jgi:hypothetical protein
MAGVPNSNPDMTESKLDNVADLGSRLLDSILDVSCVYAEGGWKLWTQRAWIVLLLVIGSLLWAYILNWGHINFLYHDWAEGIGHRIAFLQNAVRTGQLPLHMPGAFALRNVTDRYLSIADTIFSPQVLALKFLDPGDFVVFNTILLYALGVVGMAKIANRHRISPVPLTAMFLVIAFNGRITDLIVVGDVHWVGYFLLPWLVYYFLEAVESPVGWRWTLKVSLLLFTVFLQGSFHLYLISLIFMGILALTRRDLFFPLVRTGISALLVSMVRILPPAIVSGSFDVEFLSGFDSGLQMVTSLVDLKLPIRSEVFRNTPVNPLGWWEIDHYVGLIGLLFLAVFGVGLWLRRQRHGIAYQELVAPVIAMVVFSVGRLFKPISALAIPMISSQRVSTRFFILALVVLAVLAAIHLQRFLNQHKGSIPLRLSILAALAIMANDIWQHEKLWRVAHLPDIFNARDVDLSLAYVANHPDPPYTVALIVGLVISVLSLAILSWLAFKERRREIS